mgnify:CR=1 FL=1
MTFYNVDNVKKSHNGNPLRFQNNIPNNRTELRCISPRYLRLLLYSSCVVRHPITYVSK